VTLVAVIVDASAVVELLLKSDLAPRVAKRLFGQELHAPQLIDIEVLNVLRRYNAFGELSDVRAEEAIIEYSRLALERHSHEVLLHRIWEQRSNLTAYDAAYVALAELLGMSILTLDKRLAKAAPQVTELLQ